VDVILLQKLGWDLLFLNLYIHAPLDQFPFVKTTSMGESLVFVGQVGFKEINFFTSFCEPLDFTA